MSTKYNEYLEVHIECVKAAGHLMLCTLPVCKELSEGDRDALSDNLRFHDKSKYETEEYYPYDNYFYGTKNETSFNEAWLHHIHHNKHHWQHWMLMNDDGKYRDPGKVIALEMPKVYALEMVADWWAFSLRSGNLHEVFNWYEKNKDNIILHENTRAYVERVLGEIRDALDGV